MGLVLMSGRELHRAWVLEEIIDGSRDIASGAALLGLTARHMRRLIECYRTKHAAGLAHGHRDRPLNRRRPAEHRAEALQLVRTYHQGHGATLASKVLLERHGLQVPHKTLQACCLAGLRGTQSRRVRSRAARAGGLADRIHSSVNAT